MFRLVLLNSQTAPSPDEIHDSRVCVAVTGVVPAGEYAQGRIGETKADYSVESPDHGPADQTETIERSTESDLRVLREVRQIYLTASDPGLGRLASALTRYESRVNATLATDLHEKLRAGVVVTSEGRSGQEIEPGELFLLEDPESWVWRS